MSHAIAVTLATLESHNHMIDDIARGVKIYERGGVEFMEDENLGYIAEAPDKGQPQRVLVNFTRDGQDIASFFCKKCVRHSDDALCRHVVAAVLAIQGGIAETKLTIGKTATARTTVTEANTAQAVGSGGLAVFATPMLVVLMEHAACDCLADCLEDGQTSVGTAISVEHTAASPLGAEITATATITAVLGRRVEFALTASDGVGEIGKGTHTRVLVDAARFMAKAGARG